MPGFLFRSPIKELAERVGYSPWPIGYPTTFSATCMKTASTLAISKVSHSATLSTVPHE
jgi:hypothetical protein